MSLTAHERKEFERLTADIEFSNPDLKKMVKRERATTMSYVALPSRNTILMALVLINVCFFVSGVLTHNVSMTNVAGVFGILLLAAVVLNSVNGSPVVNRKMRKER